jgi:hypothetical protein
LRTYFKNLGVGAFDYGYSSLKLDFVNLCVDWSFVFLLWHISITFLFFVSLLFCVAEWLAEERILILKHAWLTIGLSKE